MLAQSSLQPEAIGVLVVLGLALASMVAAAVQLMRTRRRRRRHEVRREADLPTATRFEGESVDDVITAADAALYERDGSTVAEAALHLHAIDHVQAVPYLLHALRAVPAHQRPPLLRALAEHPRQALARHPLLTGALDPHVVTALREHVRKAEHAGSGT